MELTQAISMLTNDSFKTPGQKEWADLGCGSGTFTQALANLLPPQSIIYAMDSDLLALKKIPDEYNEVIVKKLSGDFEKQLLPFKDLDGILMANSLHYVKDKSSFIKRAASCLARDGCWLVVEYDTSKANHWVPYPIDFLSLSQLFRQEGFTSISKLQEIPSLFRQAKMYSAIARK